MRNLLIKPTRFARVFGCLSQHHSLQPTSHNNTHFEYICRAKRPAFKPVQCRLMLHMSINLSSCDETDGLSLFCAFPSGRPAPVFHATLRGGCGRVLRVCRETGSRICRCLRPNPDPPLGAENSACAA